MYACLAVSRRRCNTFTIASSERLELRDVYFPSSCLILGRKNRTLYDVSLINSVTERDESDEISRARFYFLMSNYDEASFQVVILT